MLTHKTPVSDTESTDDDDFAGEMGFYSHGTHNLTHHHWPEQIVSAGGLNVNDVQAPEASHKFNMHLASARVRHRDANQTQDSMLDYVGYHTVFEELKQVLPDACPIFTRKAPSRAHGLGMPLHLNHNFAGPERVGDKFLHSQVRLQEVEVANLLCQQLRLPLTEESHDKFHTLEMVFGQKFVLQNGCEFWATKDRRDVVRLSGYKNGNALCGEIICFLSISNLGSRID